MIIDTPSIILFITFLCNLVIGVYIINKGTKKVANLIFGSLVLQVALWNLVNFLSFILIDSYLVILFTRFALLAVLFIPSTFLFFALHFSDYKLSINKIIFLFTPSILMVPFIFTKYNIIGFNGDMRGSNFVPGKLYSVYVIYFIIFISTGLFLLVRYYRNTTNYIKRNQIQYILLGVCISAVVGITTNAILPIIWSAHYNVYGTLTSIIFGITTAYAITRYRLFNIKFVLKKWSLEFLVVIGTLAVAIVGAYVVKTIIKQFVPLADIQEYYVFTILLMVGYIFLQQYIKPFTNKFHNRDSLDLSVPEQLAFSKYTSNNLQEVYDNIQKHFQTNYQINSVTLLVFNWKEKYFQSVYLDNIIRFPEQHALAQYTKYHQHIVVKEELEANCYEIKGDAKAELRAFMKKQHIAFSIGLIHSQVLYGFIFIKQEDIPKQNGLYTRDIIDQLAKTSQQYGYLLQQVLVYEALTSRK
ncbi:MAG: histidine kinase N-terminal 7TM domain-containing protein [Patescibacteria group bacterium]|jgi:hypothetical protein